MSSHRTCRTRSPPECAGTPSKPSVLFPISVSTTRTRKEAATAAVGLEEMRDIDSLHLEGMSVRNEAGVMRLKLLNSGKATTLVELVGAIKVLLQSLREQVEERIISVNRQNLFLTWEHFITTVQSLISSPPCP